MKNFKKLTIVCVLTLFTYALNAQTEAGNLLIGGSSALSFGSTTEKYKSDDADGTIGKGMHFGIEPQVGFFVMDGLAVGLEMDLSLASFKQDDSDYKSSATTILAAPFVKYYYGTGKIKPFAQASVGLGTLIEKDKNGDLTETDKTGVFGFGAGVGAAMFLNDNVAVELGLGYNSISQKEKEDNDANFRYISGGIDFNVGIVIFL